LLPGLESIYMANGIGNYARHAKYWDWGGYDRTEEHEHWLKFDYLQTPICRHENAALNNDKINLRQNKIDFETDRVYS